MWMAGALAQKDADCQTSARNPSSNLSLCVSPCIYLIHYLFYQSESVITTFNFLISKKRDAQSLKGRERETICFVLMLCQGTLSSYWIRFERLSMNVNCICSLYFNGRVFSNNRFYYSVRWLTIYEYNKHWRAKNKGKPWWKQYSNGLIH